MNLGCNLPFSIHLKQSCSLVAIGGSSDFIESIGRSGALIEASRGSVQEVEVTDILLILSGIELESLPSLSHTFTFIVLDSLALVTVAFGVSLGESLVMIFLRVSISSSSVSVPFASLLNAGSHCGVHNKGIGTPG